MGHCRPTVRNQYVIPIDGSQYDLECNGKRRFMTAIGNDIEYFEISVATKYTWRSVHHIDGYGNIRYLHFTCHSVCAHPAAHSSRTGQTNVEHTCWWGVPPPLLIASYQIINGRNKLIFAKFVFIYLYRAIVGCRWYVCMRLNPMNAHARNHLNTEKDNICLFVSCASSIFGHVAMPASLFTTTYSSSMDRSRKNKTTKKSTWRAHHASAFLWMMPQTFFFSIGHQPTKYSRRIHSA